MSNTFLYLAKKKIIIKKIKKKKKKKDKKKKKKKRLKTNGLIVSVFVEMCRCRCRHFVSWLFQCKIEFYFTEWTPKAGLSRVAVATSEVQVFGVHEWIKFDLTLIKSNILVDLVWLTFILCTHFLKGSSVSCPGLDLKKKKKKKKNTARKSV